MKLLRCAELSSIMDERQKCRKYCSILNCIDYCIATETPEIIFGVKTELFAMVLRHIWLLPVAAVICTLIAFFSGYIIGAAKHQFPAILPFISYGGSSHPGASIFAQFLNVASFFMILTFYAKHRQFVEYYGHRLNWERTRWWRVSLALMWAGVTCALGMMLVANFRMSEVAVVHGIGAFLIFIMSLVYGWGLVGLGYTLSPRIAPRRVNHVRLTLMILATCLFILHELAVIFHIFVPKSAGAPPSKWLHIKWFPKDSPFYRNYIIATSAEWAMMLVMQAFFLSLVVELRYAYAHPPRVSFRRKPDEDEGLRGWIDVQRDVGVVHVPATQSSTQKVVGNPHQASVVGSASAGKAVVRPAQENRGHMEILDPRTPHSGAECRYCDELLKRGSKKM
ncbi:hypothetical protein NECAME_10817 [Necator americanus]|uniref:CWH43-like N-terminal domain-containing protein n=1 Tax=Necator americanus TaxID=51031 RepID=W2T9W7_NECAM|nr:hypothetical protein NECAME_10817 [Necator americanus]ETN77777.1 hypothetical protein NECAME_10817 [Necator americanus]